MRGGGEETKASLGLTPLCPPQGGRVPTPGSRPGHCRSCAGGPGTSARMGGDGGAPGAGGGPGWLPLPSIKVNVDGLRQPRQVSAAGARSGRAVRQTDGQTDGRRLPKALSRQPRGLGPAAPPSPQKMSGHWVQSCFSLLSQ